MSFDEVELQTDRLVLKRVHADLHAAEINATVCDTLDTLKPWLPWAKEVPSVEDTRLGLQRVAGDSKHYAFRLYLKNETKMIGMCGVVYVTDQQQQQQQQQSFKTYEVGYWIHRDYTKNGFMSEALDKIMNFAVNDLQADRFILKCDERNNPSKKIAEKFEFVFLRKETENLVQRPDWGELTLLHYQKMVTVVSS